MKSSTNIKGKIVSAAWKLFYEQGYEHTTIEEILWESGTSRGSFYHYFSGKDALLGSMAYLFDEKYEALSRELDPEQNAMDTLLFLTHELFLMIEQQVDFSLFARLYATQLTQNGEKQFLDKKRVYYKLLRTIMERGQSRGEITDEKSVRELVRIYALCERGVLYDWCLSGGEYSLAETGTSTMAVLTKGLIPQKISEPAE